ncbi:hypothetical protein [Nocardioides halotolerans]|uniref:hypothetical protein n=1 Tax=Nocardioides halotolerans TaxID=433660 RepID=UPI001FDF9780|nr:hypothetical protein [Nocardioides halotolerans]
MRVSTSTSRSLSPTSAPSRDAFASSAPSSHPEAAASTAVSSCFSSTPRSKNPSTPLASARHTRSGLRSRPTASTFDVDISTR